MALFEYGGRRFRICAEEYFNESQALVGYLPGCCPEALHSDGVESICEVVTNWDYLPVTPFEKTHDALRFAMEFVKLNIDAKTIGRSFRVGDKVAHIKSRRAGKVVPTTRATNTGQKHIEFDSGDVQSIQLSELTLLP